MSKDRKDALTENQKCLESISAISNARPRLPKILMILVVVFMHKMQFCIIFWLLHRLGWVTLDSMVIAKCQLFSPECQYMKIYHAKHIIRNLVR